MTRAALYVRVSTPEQTVANQELELRRWAERLGHEVVNVYADTASGARGDRIALGSVLAGAHRREFDVLLIWSLDRLSREGIGAIARYMDQLRAAGVRVQSHQEPWLDTTGPVGELLIAIFGWVAQQERQRIGERVRAGQARARAQGVHIGRKPPPCGRRGGPPAPGGGPGMAQDRARAEDPYDHYPEEVRGVPKRHYDVTVRHSAAVLGLRDRVAARRRHPTCPREHGRLACPRSLRRPGGKERLMGRLKPAKAKVEAKREGGVLVDKILKGSTTMIYAHVLHRGPTGVRSPADRMSLP